MNFLRAILMRGRGELGGIRPRRDAAIAWLPIDHVVVEAEVSSSRAVHAPAPMPSAPVPTVAPQGAPVASDRAEHRPHEAVANPDEKSERTGPSREAMPVAVRASVTRATDAVTPAAEARRPAGDTAGRSPARTSSSHAAAAPRTREPTAAHEPHVEIHIGKLEVMAPPVARSNAPARGTPAPKPLSLSDYLDARSRQR
ncbi:MAG: hypothetical protein ABWX83_11805 [Luteibacter sp.]